MDLSKVQLPEDILHLVCEELLLREDFATLFNCATSSRTLAPIALSMLYRIYTRAGSEEDETEGLHLGAQEAVARWSIAWRSIILSTSDNTLFPYYRYLRLLDLRDLRSLVEDSNFRDKIEKAFFASHLSRFRITKEFTGPRGGTITRIHITAIIEAIGDALASKASMVEQLSGEFGSAAFLRWIPGLPRLQRLELWDGEPLADEQTHQALYRHCPHFDSLSILRWGAPQADIQLGKFITGLRSQSLKSFVTIGNCGISTETCLALNKHSESLMELNLCFGPDAIPAIVLLKSCTSIEKLQLEIPPSTNLEQAQNDVFLEMIEWLQVCHALRSVILSEVTSAAAIVTPLLLNDNIHIEELYVSAKAGMYSMKDSMAFHQALANKKSLKMLSLSGEGEETTRDDIEALVASLCQLGNLRKLQLRGVADYFSDEAIICIFASLKNLEEVYIGSLGTSDEVLDAVAALPKLRSINFMGITSFTSSGLLSLVAQLGSGNAGFEISISNANPETLISEAELLKVRKALFEKVSGRLEYIALRDPEVSEFEGDDSD